MPMTLLGRCHHHLSRELASRSFPAGTKAEIALADDQLVFNLINLGEDGEIVDAKGATFGALGADASALTEERLRLWARAFCTAQLGEEPVLSQASPSLLFCDELDTEETMLAAMRDLDYGIFAQQMLEAEGSSEDQIASAVTSGNWLWVERLLAKEPALAATEPYGSPLIELAEECTEPGRERVLALLRSALGGPSS